MLILNGKQDMNFSISRYSREKNKLITSNREMVARNDTFQLILYGIRKSAHQDELKSYAKEHH